MRAHADIVSGVQVQVVEHPLARAHLTAMRDQRNDNGTFRAALADLTVLLVYEATRDIAVSPEQLNTPLAATTGYRLSDPPLLVPVLRAGLGMAGTAQDLIPGSQMGFVGIARDEQTLQPAPYMESVPTSLTGRSVIVLDPMLATGGSAEHTIRLLAGRGARDITVVCAVAAPEGIERLHAAGLPARLVTASVDEGLDGRGFILPGLGDAGDRQFGP